MLDHNHTTAGLLEMKSMFHYTSRVQTNTQIRKFKTSGFLIRLHIPLNIAAIIMKPRITPRIKFITEKIRQFLPTYL